MLLDHDKPIFFILRDVGWGSVLNLVLYASCMCVCACTCVYSIKGVWKRLERLKIPTKPCLYLIENSFQVQESDVFERDGFDIHSDVAVSFTQAILGGETRILGLNGQMMLKVLNSALLFWCLVLWLSNV